MAAIRQVTSRRVFVGRLRYGSDLLEELTEVCFQHDIRLGRVEVLGAVRKARCGFYDQQAHEYRFHEFNQPLELLQLIGNISLKDGKPFVHAHITLADETGKAFGGHLAPGTIVFAGEYVMEEFEGKPLERRFDEETGLQLWEFD